MRLAFLGSPPFATPAFEAVVAAGHEVVGLVTSPPRRAGRGRHQAENPLVSLAEVHTLPVLRPESARDASFQQAFADWGAELGLVVSYGQLLDQSLLNLPTHGCLNLHGSLLPRWRGASPVQAALLAGDAVTGVSLQQMVLALDAGPVLAERRTAIGPRETAPELFARLATLGAAFLGDFLQQLGADGVLPTGRPQDESAVTICRKVRKEDGQVNWPDSAESIDRLVRAMAGWPCAQTALPDGSGLKIHAGRAARATPSSTAAPGTILATGPALTIACGEGTFVIEELQRQGKARMAAQEFLRGSKLTVGDALQSS